VLIAERAHAIGTGCSSRNSEVVHAGLYYGAQTLKARMCVRGREMLYAYCAEHGVESRKIGKMLVATSEKQRVEGLPALKRTAEANGVNDLCVLSREDARALEPEVECAGALLSPSSGIVDSHGLMLALLGEAEAHGATLSLGTEVVRGRRPGASGEADGDLGNILVDVQVRDRADKGGAAHEAAAHDTLRLACDEVVNCAGLGAVRVGRALASSEGPAAACAPLTEAFAKGVYFKLGAGRAPFRRLVYPLPEADLGGLGVHATLDIGGQVRFGPDVEWLGERGQVRTHPDDDASMFDVDSGRAERFAAAIRSYWPCLPEGEGSLIADYAGIRPKLSLQGSPSADFFIGHDAPGVWHLAGIESPGLTSALALAGHVAERMAVQCAD